MPRVFAVASLLLLAGFSYSQTLLSPILGAGQYPHFRTISGFSGGGYGVQPDGTPEFGGAMALSTPIGYNLSNFHFAGTISNTSDYWFLRLPHVTGAQGTPDSLGDASITGGMSLGNFGSLSGSVMIVDSSLQTAFNAQYGSPLYKNIGASIGVQDIAGKGYDRGYLIPGAKTSQSWFGAVTAPLGHGIYASAGWGTKRFGKGFANLSVPIGSRFKAVIEEDGISVNEAIAWDPRIAGKSKIFGRNISTTMMVGFVESRYAFWALNVGL